MRIIGGKYGGRRIKPPTDMPHTRPTTDIAKEGLFNMLHNEWEFEGLKTLDIFGGTGAITYELASRGAEDLTIVEKDPVMYNFIKDTAAKLEMKNVQVVFSEVFQYLNYCTETFDLIFAGPPYSLSTIDELPRIIYQKKMLKPGGWFILEHTPRNDYKSFDLYLKERNYGTTIFSIFEQPDE